MRVAIVHDDLVQWGGAERVLLGITELFPAAPIYTSVYDEKNPALKERFGNREIRTSFMQRIPMWKTFYKALLPLYPIAFELFDFSDYDLVISQTTRFAKSVVTKPETTHISYCHTPPRFLWKFSGEKSPKFLELYLSMLRVYDQIAATRVDYFLAGSENARDRIQRVYNRGSSVLHPFVEQPKVESFDGNYYLIIARLNSYKKVDIAVETFNRNGLRLKVVGVGPKLQQLKSLAKNNIEFLEAVDDRVLVNLLAGCKALIVCGEEDFGLTPLEAQSYGKPVVGYGAGGVLETVVEGKTGVFFREQTAESLQQALDELSKLKVDPKDCRRNVTGFSKGRFQKSLREVLKKYTER